MIAVSGPSGARTRVCSSSNDVRTDRVFLLCVTISCSPSFPVGVTSQHRWHQPLVWSRNHSSPVTVDVICIDMTSFKPACRHHRPLLVMHYVPFQCTCTLFLVHQVNERGSAAAAVTSRRIVPLSFASRFRVDRPFLFVLRHNQFRINFFMGRVINPLQREV